MSIIKRVIILGIDGMGNSPKLLNLPGINTVLKHGLFTYNGKTEYPPISGEVWGTILHGVLPGEHKITNESAKLNLWPTNSPYPSIFRIIRQKYPKSNLASICNWQPINHGIIEHNIKVNFHSGSDLSILKKDKSYILHNDFKLLFSVFDDVDHAGHQFGYFTSKYFQQVQKTDKQILEIINVIENKGWFRDSLVMIVTDHGGGGGNPKDHGVDHPKDMTVCFGMRGPGVPHAEIQNFRNCDIPSIAVTALNIEKPSNWQGKTLQEIIKQVKPIK
ncbi:hypothetical protein M9Y10_032930 [Tritrichomonas musculus]|uniref:Uncharacterized protein n=1 Tax=Tritrichomonas musculus TaxID=1915356 RepID=A0ABR2GY63_9EUKA